MSISCPNCFKDFGEASYGAYCKNCGKNFSGYHKSRCNQCGYETDHDNNDTCQTCGNTSFGYMGDTSHIKEKFCNYCYKNTHPNNTHNDQCAICNHKY